MTVSVCITQPALQALQGRGDPGLLLGLRDAGGPCILGAAFCDLGELAAARGGWPRSGLAIGRVLLGTVPSVCPCCSLGPA